MKGLIPTEADRCAEPAMPLATLGDTYGGTAFPEECEPGGKYGAMTAGADMSVRTVIRGSMCQAQYPHRTHRGGTATDRGTYPAACRITPASPLPLSRGRIGQG